ncbi:ATP-binding protein [Streptomyces ficellus]|uniref:ATP-binding protein n=1 Tax=Streptomyces ficellus TaxID=1977088 RepID=A0A6I6F689_9ACTN|nr:ATP-binding protein [Streptomyces ficellus]QGV79170.1 ATP-binding protein [Streptomyces ficellus]
MNHENTTAVASARHFSVQLSSTRRGARLARLLATEQLRSWGVPFDVAELVIGELAANAVLHGRVAGRDFRLTLAADARTLRIAVTDTRGDRMPVVRPGAEESGRGLLLVEALAERWGVTHGPVPRKTVWADIGLVP